MNIKVENTSSKSLPKMKTEQPMEKWIKISIITIASLIRDSKEIWRTITVSM